LPRRFYRVLPGLELSLISVGVQVFGRRHDEAIDALMRPATEKRQGTKSRSEVHRWCGGLYGELTAAHELEAV
jgi:hypothetical protein